jgi:hypothetical protein
MTREQIVEGFVVALSAAIETEATNRALDMVNKVFTNNGTAPPSAPVVRKRKAVQCPVPYCRNVAAPVFGMVCSKHKDLPKSQVKRYREKKKASTAAN